MESRNNNQGIERKIRVFGVTDDVTENGSGGLETRRELVLTEIELSRGYRDFATSYLNRKYFRSDIKLA